MKALKGAKGDTTVATLPANNTARWFFDYITGSASYSLEHTVALRFNQVLPGSGDTDPQTRFLNILQAFATTAFRPGWRIIRVRYQGAGTLFSLPVTPIAGLAAFVGTGPGAGGSSITETQEATFQGRSFTSGRKVDFSLYGLVAAMPETFRYTGATPAYLPAVVTALNNFSTAPIVTIDGSTATWYPYMNMNFNSYWERRQRAG